MRSNLDDNRIDSPTIKTRFKLASARFVLAGDITLSTDGPIANYFDCSGANRNVTLSGYSDERVLFVANVGASHNVVLKDPAAVTLATIPIGKGAWLFCSGVDWVAYLGGLFSEVVEDTTPQLGGDLDLNGFTILNMVIGTDIQAWDADLDALATAFRRATAANAASLDFAEDTDNGVNYVRLTAPSSLTGDRTLELPDASATLVGHDTTQTLTNKTIDAASNTVSNLATSMFAANVVDTDGTLAANSDARLATQKAVKTYADALIAANDAMVYKGATDCSTNPDYPAANRGDTYRVSVAGKIGGASGVTVDVGDFFICNTDSTVSGDQAAVGTSWNVIQTNIVGAYYAGGTDVAIADGGTGASTAAGGFDALKQAATESYTGVVELATTTEAATRTDTSRAITAAGLDAAIEAAPDIRRNRIVNPCMQISQENGNTAGTTNGYYPADQWRVDNGTDAAFSAQRVASVTPAGALYRTRISITTADASIGSTQALNFLQTLEGSRLADFLFGAANAKAGVIRIGMKAPAGTYGVSIRNAAVARSFVGEVTISGGEANTDVLKEVTFTGDTTGTWPTGDELGWYLTVALAAGSARHGSLGWNAGNFTTTSNQSNGASSNTNVFEFFDIGLKMDVDGIGQYGAFEVPDPAAAKLDCLRYFKRIGNESATERFANGFCANTTVLRCSFSFLPPMRTGPTTSLSSAGDFEVESSTVVTLASASSYGATTNTVTFDFTVASGLTAGYGGMLRAKSPATPSIFFNARM